VGARVELSAVPVAAALRDGAATLEVDPLELAVGGGEDYELLATMDPAGVERAAQELRDRFGVALTTVGQVVPGEGVTAIDAGGREGPLEPRGWDHFA
jgi:thiamine-monophosphate kinase